MTRLRGDPLLIDLRSFQGPGCLDLGLRFKEVLVKTTRCKDCDTCYSLKVRENQEFALLMEELRKFLFVIFERFGKIRGKVKLPLVI